MCGCKNCQGLIIEYQYKLPTNYKIKSKLAYNMSINIFQFLKEGTSLKKENINRLKTLQQKIEVKPRQVNEDYATTGKFKESDSQDVSDNELDSQQRMKSMRRAQQQRILIRKLYHIKVEGDSVPPLLNNFTKIIKKYNIKPELVQSLGRIGLEHPTPVQMQVIPALLENRNVLATAPTGSGKTLAFTLPLLQNITHKKLTIQSVVFAPTLQLSDQIWKQMKSLQEGLNLKITCLSHLSQKQKQRLTQNKPISADILLATPLSFINWFRQKQELLTTVQYLIFDECDKYFEQSFLQQIKQILSYFQERRRIYGMFSATIQHPVEQLLHSELLQDAVRVEIGGKNNVLNKIRQSLEYCSNQYGKLVQIRNIINEGRFTTPVLMFVQEKARAKQLFFQMRKIMMEAIGSVSRVEYITADKSKTDRDSIIQKFQSGEIWVLVATDLIARGIDFKRVNLVINYDFPTSMLTYIHRVGRTGRADRQGDAITFYTDEDKFQLRSLANLLKISGCQVPAWIFELKSSNKRQRKYLEKHPVKRESISLNSKKHIDPKWRKELAISEKKFVRKFKKEQQEKEKEGEDDEGWQVVTE